MKLRQEKRRDSFTTKDARKSKTISEHHIDHGDPFVQQFQTILLSEINIIPPSI